MYRRPVVAVAYAISAMALGMSVVACGNGAAAGLIGPPVASAGNIGPPVPSAADIGPPVPSAAPEKSELTGTASVMRIVPTSGPFGSRVTITGTDFIGTRAVCFGTSPSSYFHVNDSGSRITVVVPAGSGTVQVTVVTKAGVSAMRASGDTFTYSGSAATRGVESAAASASPCAAASPEPSP
jgi:hypothetical protein